MGGGGVDGGEGNRTAAGLSVPLGPVLRGTLGGFSVRSLLSALQSLAKGIHSQHWAYHSVVSTGGCVQPIGHGLHAAEATYEYCPTQRHKVT